MESLGIITCGNICWFAKFVIGECIPVVFGEIEIIQLKSTLNKVSKMFFVFFSKI